MTVLWFSQQQQENEIGCCWGELKKINLTGEFERDRKREQEQKSEKQVKRNEWQKEKMNKKLNGKKEKQKAG